MMNGVMVRALTMLLVVVMVLAVHASPSDNVVARARSHYEIGNGKYELGLYCDAIAEFAAGYRLLRKPGFLINLGQSYRKLNELGRAREMYERYLSEAPLDDPDRKDVTGVLAKLDGATESSAVSACRSDLGDANAATAAPDPKSDQKSDLKSELTTNVHKNAAPKPSFWRKNWWIIPVAGAVVGTALGVGIYYGTRSGCDAKLGCYDLK